MSKGRGSAVAVVLVLCLLVLQYEVARAAVFNVGDAGGWTFNTVGWPNGKSFKAGDTLVFKYSRGAHNVVVVNKGAYGSCSAPGGAKVYTSGNDRINLVKGQNSFICSFAGHCQSGMKISVFAA